jgi:adenosine deaminase
VPALVKHPFKKFLDEQVRVTLNTDDPGISDITLTHEVELAARAFGLTGKQVRELQANAARAAFAPASVRAELEARVA